MRTVEEHLAAVLADLAPLPARRLPLSALRGLVLAEPIHARVDLPGFDNSAMDGYAVRSADLADLTDPVVAAPRGSVTLSVVEQIAAGDAPRHVVGAGEASAIMTGAKMPAGADAVVRVEDTDGGSSSVRIHAAVRSGASVRSRGEDVTAGELVLSPGDVLHSRRVGLLAATGHADALVIPAPRVAVVSTGSELTPPGEVLPDGHIHDSNSYMLEAAIIEIGAIAVRVDPVADDARTLADVLRRLTGEVDAIVTSGGVSMGSYDVVKEAFLGSSPEGPQATGVGGGVEFVQVAMQPGKPQGFGYLPADDGRAVPIFALPGNPVSSYVSTMTFVRPALRRMMGLPDLPSDGTAVLTHGLTSPPGRRQIARAVVTVDGAVRRADPVWGQASHFVADLSRANAFVVIGEDVESIEAGAEVPVVLLPGDPPVGPGHG